MSVRSFWAIALKLFGFYILLKFLYVLPDLLTVLLTIFQQANNLTHEPSFENYRHLDITTLWFQVGYLVVSGTIYFLLARTCLFKTDWLTEKLRLTENIEDERLEFNLHRSTVLKIIIVVLGALTIIDSLPPLIQNIYAYLQMDGGYTKFTSSPQAKYIAANLVQFFLGYFMLSCSRMIVNYFELKRKGKAVENVEVEE